MQSIIEKTAFFISKQSGQMEIVLKTKQSGNPQFAFLNFDNYLNPYYKFILGKIKEGVFKPAEEPAKEGLCKYSCLIKICQGNQPIIRIFFIHHFSGEPCATSKLYKGPENLL